MQGETRENAAALGEGRTDLVELSDKDAALLQYVRQLTLDSHTQQAEDAQRLRNHGWTDPQIAEAVHVAALFALFNRVASAFGLQAEMPESPTLDR